MNDRCSTLELYCAALQSHASNLQLSMHKQVPHMQQIDFCADGRAMHVQDILDNEQLDDPMNAYNTTPCSSPVMTAEGRLSRSMSDLSVSEYSEEERLFAIVGVLVCAMLRKLLLRVLGEHACAPSLKTLQVLCSLIVFCI